MRVRFGEQFVADLETGELFRNGRLQHLQDKPFRLLELLLSKPSRLARYDEIQRHLWRDVNVDARHSIKEAAQKVRTALGSDAHRLQCLRGRGYRLMAATVTVLEETPDLRLELLPAYNAGIPAYQ
ncbi:MAG TPA: winged helix-turn-helix domain-containing protein [Terriglobia bacterium]|nr:winged helix-turn-helix domain-containing protein [Terriglobia bacterium]